MPEEHNPLTEEEIRRIVREEVRSTIMGLIREEVRKQLHEMVHELRLLSGMPQRSRLDLEQK